jgi:hypothetical protein
MTTVAFVLSATRSGSTWLGLVLGSHTGAATLGEFFRPFLISGHVACRLCEANGRRDCVRLHGIETIAPDDAFTFAADRLQCGLLIDVSKRLDWCVRFLDRPGVDPKLVHLVRHPCGFVSSEARRRAGSPEELLSIWQKENELIDAFTRASKAPSMLVCYDDLADQPDRHFPILCDFLGISWNAKSLQYWNFPHHGLGGNGAASLYLRGRLVENYTTGDDAFYQDLPSRAISADRRWQVQLDAAFRRHAVNTQFARDLRQRLGGGDWEY